MRKAKAVRATKLTRKPRPIGGGDVRMGLSEDLRCRLKPPFETLGKRVHRSVDTVARGRGLDLGRHATA
jgi:hypothetical protein